MSDLVVHEQPELSAPVLVVMLAGWIDAGGAAALAATTLDAAVAARPIATFDGDRFLDFRARRPVMTLRDGVNAGLVWPEIVLKAGRDAEGNDVLLLLGHEPDMAWHAFCRNVVEFATNAGVRLVVGLGAYPFATPHTRPSRLSMTANTEELARSVPYLRNSLDVPAGVEAALESAFAEAGVPAIGLWAQVPHYLAGAPYPAAADALLTGLGDVAGVRVGAEALRADAEVLRSRVDALVVANPEHVAMVGQFEQVYDAEAASAPAPAPFDEPLSGPLPSGDELAAELERFLREQG